MLQKSLQLSRRATQFFGDIFEPRYGELRRAASETPLLVLMWGPSGDWYRQRLQIRDSLVERGHQVALREDLGIPAGHVAPRAVDLIPRHSTDVAVVIQSAYSSIGDVQDFAEFSVVESRMLIFMDESAKDRRSYLPSVAQLQLLYNNVETFKSPGEIVKGTVLQLVLDKIATFQWVKYFAQRSARRWGLNFQNYPLGARVEELRVFPYNLLELNRVHRGEIDLLKDSTSLYLLALIHDSQGSSYNALTRDTGLAGLSLQRKLTPLLTSRMLAEDSGILQITSLGTLFLNELGLPTPPRRVETGLPRVAPVRSFPSRYLVASAIASFVLLCLVSIFLWFDIVQSQLPLAIIPSRTIAATPTTVFPLPSPTPTNRR